MGNAPASGDGSTASRSSAPGPPPVVQNIGRFLQRQAQGNSLGLTKAQLDERCQPSGLYPSCQWEERTIRRLIGDGKLAARCRGTEERKTLTDAECPICFLQYQQVNVTKCCNAFICTECYLQVRPQKEKSPTCPFCNVAKLSVEVAPHMELSDVQKREQEAQAVIEAQIRARNQNQNPAAVDSAPQPEQPLSTTSEQAPGTPSSLGAASPQAPPSTGFGSSLERNERVALMRARSASMGSDHNTTPGRMAAPDSPPGAASNSNNFPDISALAMTPEERRTLEEEMRQQHYHPLSQRLQAEEAERRLRNEQEYYRAQAARLQELRVRREMLRNSMLGPSRMGAAAGSGGNISSSNTSSQAATGGTALGTGERPSGDESGEAPAAADRPAGASRGGRDWNRIVEAFERSGRGGSVQSLDDLVVLEAAIMLSMEEEARRRREGQPPEGGREGGADETEEGGTRSDAGFDAERHASQGFPLARDRIDRQLSGGSAGGSGSREGDMDDHLQSLMRNLQRRRSNRQQQRMPPAGPRGARGIAPDMALDAVSLAMRGVSEEEQIAMAIAASLEDHGGGDAAESQGGGEEGETQTEGVAAASEDSTDDAVQEEASHADSGGVGTVQEPGSEIVDTIPAEASDVASQGQSASGTQSESASDQPLGTEESEQEEVNFDTVQHEPVFSTHMEEALEEAHCQIGQEQAPPFQESSPQQISAQSEESAPPKRDET